MDFLIKMLGLDSKVRQKALEYVLYITLAGAFLLHIGDVLIALGNVCLVLSAAVGQLNLFVNGSLGIMATIGQIKLKLAGIGPIMTKASPDFHYCIGAIGAGILYLKVKLNHLEHAQAIASNTQVLNALTTPVQAPPANPPVEVKS